MQVKITSFHWHDTRHDFASKMVIKGVPLKTVREICGHPDLNTTLRYAHSAPDHKADAIALIG
ncbi:tyrosine-type recombinase/integrase [Pseudoteredinibacter isoporae]|uniref:Site-specific recombinase XerD n=1 Tax=Pseudoteredinibacter isoporae TaxID=570281 RepID=A0A7X0JV37_9GAMM|nr:site-specific recombinase XerD [Pseudoteredinibacter isoporae]NHO87811.1 tyrosine-type recombinase/integrase [Pseudoteredinibacter isoporae]NIB23858.1 tyrosine-type recombinase/integrase [Pseudoteredinibacter isoporae]